MFIFADRGGRGVKKLVIFCGRHKWMTPKVTVQITEQSSRQTQGCKQRPVTGNYRPFFSFNNHLFVCLPVNISYIVCESSLIKITFEISKWSFYTEKNYKKHCILLKTNFEIPLFLRKEFREQTIWLSIYIFTDYLCSYFRLL